MDRSTTACFGLKYIHCFTVNVETHFSSVKSDDGVWLCGSVVHQHLCLFDGLSGGQILLRANFVERDDHGGIDSA